MEDHMNTQYEKLTKVLNEIFQFDNEDLDFGIYRIMNQKRADIKNFLDNELLPQAKEALQKYNAADQSELKKEIAELQKQLDNAGVPYETSRKYVELQGKLNRAVDIEAVEQDIYSNLANFFRRYYDKGDFLSVRRYKKDVYAVPYEGEEVKLHWANADQYYVKSSEYFRDYSFKLTSGRTVHFVVTEASTEQNNNKEQEGKERKFLLYEESPVYEEKGDLFFQFEYKLDDSKISQSKLNEHAIEMIIGSENVLNWKEDLSVLAPTEKNRKRTLLEKHLTDYTARNTFDYFIHKDLGGFLRRELDFFIKNEIMHIDDIDTDNEARIEQYLSKIRVLKSIGRKIIAFLEQIENFQKKLWLKKKFVVETNYCITLDHIIENAPDLIKDIVQNEAQIEEWERLFDISSILEGKMTVDFLRENQYLLLDTSFFEDTFKDKLLSCLDNVDKSVNGLLVNSDNFHALNLLKTRYKKQVNTVYIDPPYNTVHSEILYKNQFKHSSWLSLIANTAKLVPFFWQDEFSFGLAIDDYEFVNLAGLLDTLYPQLERTVVVVNHHPQGAGGRISRTHEYFILLSPSNAPAYLGNPQDDYEEDRSFMRSGTAENNFRHGRWKSFYALLLDPKSNEIVDVEDPVPLGEAYPTENTKDGCIRIYPINSKGEERVWRSSYITGRQRAKNKELVISDRSTVYQTINHESKREVLFSNWTDSKFNSGIHGSNVLRDFGLGGNFDYPKSIYTLETTLWAQTYGRNNALILDYFAGSGTTGHAVINLNRQDEGSRKYILVEMGNHFNTALKPRIQKAVYSIDWKNGKPVTRNGTSQIIKYMKLESYEDSLNNIELTRTKDKQLALNLMTPEAKEEYILSYMLDVESAGSSSLLNLKAFENPFNYKLKIVEGSETKLTIVDVVETFNYLLGLTVIQIETIQGYKVIKGKMPSNERVIIIWRNLIEKTNEDLEQFFAKQGYNTLDNEFDIIYVNGDNHLENLKVDESSWKVKLIEEDFKRLMFDVEDV
jgi:adenine-specific DNA-methyltransferase